MTIKHLRRQAIAGTLFAPTTLASAIERLGFVQCDPIRAPARAQDLILRQRVEGYRAGDLEREYPKLGLEEDFVYAYGVVPESTWRLLHPRAKTRLTRAEERVRELVCAQAYMHPRELEPHLGRKRAVNAWGSYSKATTRILERLHHCGVLRIAGRRKGIRLYQAAREQCEPIATEERQRRLILLVAKILSPVPERSLRTALSLVSRSTPILQSRAKALKKLIDGGDLSAAEVDGIKYLWPTGNLPDDDVPAKVRFLAPFDPLVWDRYRFEHLWGWAYRFEAYTPPEKRKMGYYALPLLWGENLIGWVNVSQSDDGVKVEADFVSSKPRDRAFREAYKDEVERMRQFLTRSC